jgi:hypothetical protein
MKYKRRYKRERRSVLLLITPLQENDKFSEGLSPSSIYMRGKEGQKYICGQCPYKQLTIITCRLTHVKQYTTRVHMSSSKMMSSTKKDPNAKALYKVCPMLLLQASKDYINPPNLCTPLGPLPLC